MFHCVHFECPCEPDVLARYLEHTKNDPKQYANVNTAALHTQQQQPQRQQQQQPQPQSQQLIQQSPEPTTTALQSPTPTIALTNNLALDSSASEPQTIIEPITSIDDAPTENVEMTDNNS